MLFRLIRTIAALSFAIFSSLASGAWLGAQHYVNCKSDGGFSLTFELNNIFKTVKILGFEDALVVSDWSEQNISISSPMPSRLSSFVFGAVRSDNLHMDFDRLRGTLKLWGTNSPPKGGWVAETSGGFTPPPDALVMVTEEVSLKCEKIDPKF